MFVATVELGEEQRKFAEDRFGPDGYRFVITSPFDIFWELQARFRESDSRQARDALYLWKPEHSAKLTVTRSQKTDACPGSGSPISASSPSDRGPVWSRRWRAITILYTVTFLFKFLLTWIGASRKVDMDITPEEVAALTDAELPVYTVLVPMYREARVLPLLFKALKALDYPAAKLEVKLVLEEDDTETIEAAKALRPPGTFEIVRVPPSYPKTKPKACNYALFFARGEFITIYDAEDQPEPDQLKKAVIAFRRSGDKLACVQARLNYFNRSRELADADVHARIFAVVRLPAARPRHAEDADSARRNLEPLPPVGAAPGARLGSLQRHGGCRPRRPPGAGRLFDRRHQLDHIRGGQRRPAELDPPALALDQGLHADLARPHAPPDRAVADDRAAGASSASTSSSVRRRC